MTLLRTLTLLLLTVAPGFARSDTCFVRVNSLDVVVDADMFRDPTLSPSRRERLLDWPRRSLSRAMGNPPPCGSDTVLVFMAELTEIYRTDGYCLEYGDADSGYLLVPGDRNYRGRCTKTTCDRVEGAASDLLRLTQGVTTILGEPADTDEILRSGDAGAMILTGSQSFVRRRLNDFAFGALVTALATPEIAAATAVSVVAVGGGVFVCGQ